MIVTTYRILGLCSALLLAMIVPLGTTHAAPHGVGGLRGAGRGRPPKVLGTQATEEASKGEYSEVVWRAARWMPKGYLNVTATDGRSSPRPKV